MAFCTPLVDISLLLLLPSSFSCCWHRLQCVDLWDSTLETRQSYFRSCTNFQVPTSTEATVRSR